MTQIATVEKILPGGMAEISVPRKSACGHDCEECAGCGVSGASVLVGYFATGALESEGLRYAVAIAAFLIGIIPAIICDRRTKKNGKLTFTIVRLF